MESLLLNMGKENQFDSLRIPFSLALLGMGILCAYGAFDRLGVAENAQNYGAGANDLLNNDLVKNDNEMKEYLQGESHRFDYVIAGNNFGAGVLISLSVFSAISSALCFFGLRARK